MKYILEHVLNSELINIEHRDAGYIPCMVADTLELAKESAERITAEKGGDFRYPPEWYEDTWVNGIKRWLESYRLPSGVWCIWRIVELPENEFTLGYEFELWS